MLWGGPKHGKRPDLTTSANSCITVNHNMAVQFDTIAKGDMRAYNAVSADGDAATQLCGGVDNRG